MSRMVIALGGNALGKTPLEQKMSVKKTAVPIVNLIEKGHELILTHGNGPQVGMINLAFEHSSENEGDLPEMPFPECGAMSQGYIGFHLQNALGEEIKKRSLNCSVSTIITQVIVDAKDEAFDNPSKPIGNFYNKDDAEKLAKEKRYNIIEDAGRGYRRVVPSPLPIDIEEKEIIKILLDSGQIVISCGGGGIPVIKDEDSLKGVPAVIDKDFASSKLAQILDADLLVILTAVEKVAINFGKENQQWLNKMTVDEAKKFIDEGQFAAGSMLPKIKASIDFVAGGSGRKALITSLDKAKDGINGKTGTYIIE